MDDILSPSSNLFPEDPAADDDNIWFVGIPREARSGGDPGLASPPWSDESSCSPPQFSIDTTFELINSDGFALKAGNIFLFNTYHLSGMILF